MSRLPNLVELARKSVVLRIAFDPDWQKGMNREAKIAFYRRKPRHKAAARVLGYAVTLNSAEAWCAAATVWHVRLTPQEAAGMAWAALKALEPEIALMTAETALGGAGAP